MHTSLLPTFRQALSLLALGALLFPTSGRTETSQLAVRTSAFRTPLPLQQSAEAREPIAGRWNLRGSILEVSSTGSFVNWAPNYREEGRWTKIGGSKYAFDWSDGRRKEEFTLSGNELKKYRKHDGWKSVGQRIR